MKPFYNSNIRLQRIPVDHTSCLSIFSMYTLNSSLDLNQILLLSFFSFSFCCCCSVDLNRKINKRNFSFQNYRTRTKLCSLSMYDKIFGLQHRSTVLRLYKTILRLHQSLPTELRALGNTYVRDEFRRHKNAQPEFVTNFMVEWSVSISTRSTRV